MSRTLLLKPKLFNYLRVSGRRLLFQKIQKALAFGNHLEQTRPGTVVLLMFLEMLGQRFNFLGKQGNLNLRRTGVALVPGMLADDFLFGFGF